jgi:hypothetical protein
MPEYIDPAWRVEATRLTEEDRAEDVFLSVLDATVDALDTNGVPYMLMGGIASSVHGRPRWTHDIDVLVKPTDAKRALEALEGAGFVTEEAYADWLYKGFLRDVMVDIIFRSAGEMYLDDEMLTRVVLAEFKGRMLRVIPAEDLMVMKAVVHNEHMPRHWHDALGLIAAADLDWNYVLKRARRHGARRLLALLLYAQSNDLVVPDPVVRQLFEMIFGRESANGHRP